MTTADVLAFPPATADDLDLEQVRARAAALDLLADLLDEIRYVLAPHVHDPNLAEQQRSLADVLYERADAPEPDVVAIRRLLPRSVELVRRGSDVLCHASARRMFGSALYERVAPVVLTLGELGTEAYFTALDAAPDTPIEELPLRRFGRVAAIAYDWAQWNVDASPGLRRALHAALRGEDSTGRAEPVDAEGDPLPDPRPLVRVLETVHDAWLECVPADVLAECVAERDRHGERLGDCFDLGVALSIARRLVITPHGSPVTDTVDIDAWRVAAGLAPQA